MEQAVEIATELSETMAQWGEIATASGTVISRRVALALQAFTAPGIVDHTEFTTMATEKMDAVVDIATGFAQGLFSMGLSCGVQLLSETSRATLAAWKIGLSGGGLAAAEVQHRWMSEYLGSANDHAQKMMKLVSGFSTAATQSVHSRATANARRLACQ